MYNYGYESVESAGSSASGLIGVLLILGATFYLIALAIGIFTLICNWKVYKRAGKPGWATLIPIYNSIVLLEICELPMWYILLLIIPFVNIYAVIKIYIELAKKFGQSTAFGIGLLLLNPIFMAILAFSKDINYVGSNQSQTNNSSTQSSKFCVSCGSQLAQDAKFCTCCGKQV